ncbi:hypothetical protein M3P21_18910 [Ruegeria sp. 2012CJ41-6]|uniref:Uncharacterized protein n=1 Tax=Ruegeria spongiae TaxID=2942209 RepID=A0ABT0Q6Z2_9RHOB|nr:hypothetical protein [Ruegeria spongiae]MCL6285605.1 hypothetical protein [Ruegeria spongiae]
MFDTVDLSKVYRAALPAREASRIHHRHIYVLCTPLNSFVKDGLPFGLHATGIRPMIFSGFMVTRGMPLRQESDRISASTSWLGVGFLL